MVARTKKGATMTLDEFRKALNEPAPPSGPSHALAGLWWDAKGDWKHANESAQQDEGPDGSWVHAYLHRKEGDHGSYFHFPISPYWVLVVNAATYGLVGLMVETLRQKLHHA